MSKDYPDRHDHAKEIFCFFCPVGHGSFSLVNLLASSCQVVGWHCGSDSMARWTQYDLSSGARLPGAIQELVIEP